ncbi:hypothetical protein, variant [Aphanomyces invadans]|uniref:EF-hand domain-containing protein n=1 Tax=Aphanomyces invadans TaxID=157072 RepID=A0A024UQX2_9STRA|nr:hypothetical protein, variant [Aphanomyces invadans]ETW08846.1 hypothetical protein, variant [Aphanomyces invadans]|eukprot:XP_008862651.1 hypothetical protein, variant [Aphanomyces invadans]
MQQSPSGGSVADARPPALEWRPYGILLLSGSTKVEKTAKEKLLTVLSGSLTPRERGVFKVIKRVDLALDGKGADPDALAGAFYKMLDQDRIEYTTPKPPPPATAVVPPLATPPTATPANPPLATAAKPTALPPNTSKRENSRKTSSIDLNAEDESPEEDLLPAAAVALEVDLRTGSPSHIYVFVDYPASVAEVKSLVAFKASPESIAMKRPPTLTSLIDGVVLMTVASAKDEPRRQSIVNSAALEAAKDIVQAAAAPPVAATPAPKPAAAKAKGKKDSLAPPSQPVPVVDVSPVVVAAPPSDSHQSANLADVGDINRLFKELQAAGQVGGLEWTDFSFDVVDCGDGVAGEAKPLAMLTRELKTLLANLAVDKLLFKTWLSSIQIIPVPTQDALPEKQMDALKQTYADILDVLYEPSVGVSAIVYAMTETVVKSFVKPAQPPPLPTSSKKKAAPPAGEPKESSALSPLPKPVANPTAHSFPPFIEYGDVSSVRLARAVYQYSSKHPLMRSGEPRVLLGRPLDDLEKSLWLLNDLPGVGHGGRKGMPVVPTKSFVERSIDDTELMQFHSLSIADVHYTRKMMEFETMLGPKWQGKLRSRTFHEHLAPHVLPQRLSALIGLNVRLIKRYYAADDTLLLAGHVETPQGRTSIASWSAADSVRHRPPFKDWRQENLLPEAYLTPRTVQALGAVVSLSMGELQAVSEVVHSLYPSDHSIIQVLRTPYSSSWLSVYKDNHVFGLRPTTALPVATVRPAKPSPPFRRDSKAPKPSVQWTDFPATFHASFSDDSHLRIGRGLGKAIVLTYTVPSGLVLTVSSDGTIRQQYANSTSHAATPNNHESNRVILGRGTVVSTRKDNSQAILYASGRMAKRSSPTDTFVTVDEQGVVTCGKNHAPLPNVPVHIDVDPETRAVIATRDDGVIVVTHPNGAYLTQHDDGTRMYGNASNSHVVVQKEGYAEVSVDVDVNVTAQRHALGMKVAVTKGGIRTRSVIRTDDGTVIEIDYDTRVIASVNGIIRVRKPDGTVAIASDNGVVEFRPRGISLGDAPPTPRRENEEEMDSSTGAYYFNCATGSLQMNDHEHNAYSVLVGDGTIEPQVQVELAGVVTIQDCANYGVPPLPVKAVVNNPLEPFLLFLHGDGTATEILRPSDVVDYFQQVQRNPHVQRVTSEPPSNTHIYLHHLDRFEQNELWFADHKERQRLLECVTIPARASRGVRKLLHNSVPLQLPRVHIVRHIKEVTVLTPEQFTAMLNALDAWREWCAKREIAQDQYAVFDPRDSETMVATMAVQKKIQAAYKAARAKKKAERQKSKEREKHEVADGDGNNMSTLQEVDNEEDEEDDLDEGYRALDDSDNDSRDELDFNVDDDYELTLTAFGQADTENTGRLNAVQTRRALVHALGTGVTQAEVNAAIQMFTECEDSRVTFEAFSRMLNAFREDQDITALADLTTPRSILPLKLKSPRAKMPSPRGKVGGGPYGA